MRSSVLSFFILVLFACIACLSPTEANADKSDSLKKLLIDLDGWEAEAAEGASFDMGGMKMINAMRNYSNSDESASIDIMVIAGTSAMMQGQMENIDFESDEGNVKVHEIDGFKAVDTFSKEEKAGHIVINLVKKEAEGAIFIFSYSGLTSEKALELSKKLNWKQLKAETAKLLE